MQFNEGSGFSPYRYPNDSKARRGGRMTNALSTATILACSERASLMRASILSISIRRLSQLGSDELRHTFSAADETFHFAGKSRPSQARCERAALRVILQSEFDLLQTSLGRVSCIARARTHTGTFEQYVKPLLVVSAFLGDGHSLFYSVGRGSEVTERDLNAREH
jgi:hypothetical protein